MMNMQKWCWKVAVSLCGMVMGHAALAADACVATDGSAPLIFNYEFKPSYDISTLAVGSVIDTVSATSSSSLTTNCSGATGTKVGGGLVPGGGLTTNAFSSTGLQTRVSGVAITIKASNGADASFPYPQRATNAHGGTFADTWTITFTKVSSDTTGNDTLPASASTTYAMGDNRLRVLQFVLSNSIKFIRGNVTTCIPTVLPGNAITLPKVSTSALAANGQKAGRTPFSIRLDSCKTSGVASNAVNVRTFFDGPRVNATTGNLDVTGAANVQLQLSNGDGSVINLAGVKGSQNVATTQIRAGTATLPYAVSYFATGKAGAGAVSSTVNFTMEFP